MEEEYFDDPSDVKWNNYDAIQLYREQADKWYADNETRYENEEYLFAVSNSQVKN
jgi:hypothetical protein